MKTVTLLFMAALIAISTTAFAVVDCPLKNLRKSQTLFADGSAYHPQKQQLPSHQSGSGVGVRN